MAFRNILNLEPGFAQKCLRLCSHVLPVLHGTGRVVGDPQRMRGGRKLNAGQKFNNVLCLGADSGSPCGIDGIKAQHMAIILDRGAAARCGNDDRISPRIGPVMNIAARPPDCIGLLAHMMGEGAATALPR